MVATESKKIGVRGEDLACAELAGHAGAGAELALPARREIDIVAAEAGPTGLTLVFCEVKCRSGLGFGHPLEAITYTKMQRCDSWPRCGYASIACGHPASDWTPLALCCSPDSSRR
jgi:Holliday junction resolvase-like predicted endonuclease